ncbi:MAG: PAS domain S-box protein, partial [Bacteroidota bacterium]|nr:PAS domain S-box protein [Bacteroidota bacterium]
KHPAEKSFDEIRFKDGRVFERISKAMFVGDKTFGRVWSFLDITERNKAEEEKTYQLLHYKMLMHTSQDAIHILNKNGKLVEYNEAFVKHLGYTEEETSKLYLWDWDTQWNKEELLKILSEAKEEGMYFETMHKLKDGSGRNVHVTLHKFSEKGDNFYYSSARDITERKKAEAEREQFFKFFNISSDLMVIADPDGCFLKINPAGLILLGYTEEELLTKPFIDFVHPDDRQNTLDEMARQIRTGNSMNFENRYLCKDSTSKILSWRANYVAKEGITYATARDITKNKLAEEEIKKLNRIHEFIGQTNELILLAKNEDEIYNGISRIAVETGNFVFSWIGIVDANTKKIKPFAWAGKEDGYLSNLNISTEDVPAGSGPTGKAYRQANYYYCNDIANDPVMENWRDAAIKRGYLSSVAFPLKTDNKVVSVITMYAPKANFFTHEELQLLVGVTNNISYALNAISNRKKRKETEIQLKKITEAVKQSSASIVITNLKPEIEYVNPAFTELTGYSFEEALGKNPSILKSGFTPESTYPELWQHLMNGMPWHGELCNRKKNGEFYWEQAVISPITNEQGEITNYVAVKENITARKLIEESLRLSEAKMRAILENSFDAIGVNVNGVWEMCNPAALKLFGYTDADELVGTPIINVIAASEHERLKEYVVNRMEGKEILSTYITRGLRKDGTEFDLEVSLSDYIQENKLHSLAILRDITERKNHEKEMTRLNAELRELANHLSTIREDERSDIAKEIHDELSQNLVVISMNAAHLKNKINDPAVKAIIDEQIEISNSVLKTSKTLFNSLHPSMLDELGLEAAIKWYAKTKLKSSKIQFEFRTNINIGNDSISKTINLGFFRIYQETLSNILRHANATKISVELHKTKEYLSMRINDNGSGFEIDKIDTLHHHGILGIRERALAMGGEFTINSFIGEGTTVQVKVKI